MSAVTIGFLMTPTPGSYDDHQLAAQLICCAGCGRSYYMTTPRAQCLVCAPWEGAWLAGSDPAMVGVATSDVLTSQSNILRIPLASGTVAAGMSTPRVASTPQPSAPSIAQTDLAGRVLYE